MPRTRALHACHKQREVILPRITSTFHVAPEAGWARRRGPSELILRIPGRGAIVLYSVCGVVWGHVFGVAGDGCWGCDPGEVLESVIAEDGLSMFSVS